MDKKYRIKDAFLEFFKKNKNAVYLLPILVVVLIIAIVVFINGEIYIPASNINLQDQTDNSPVDGHDGITASNTIEILPKIERSEEDKKNNSNIISNSSANPFELPMKVTGVVIESNDKSIAIIETAHTSYIVKVGDFISDSWQVRNIEENGVLLVNGQKEAHIPFDD
ncbi:MAG: hypothetical protein GYA02_14215 [Clostridiaceae bacterium]|nr:hypothetical protein [Clostridiaceae bacterium]